MRLLIANPFGIGDVLFSLPLVQEIRRQRPEAFLGYGGNRRTLELISVWPELNWHRPLELRSAWRRSRSEGWEAFRTAADSIRKERFDFLLDLSLGWQVGFLAWIAGIPQRIGLNYRERGRFLTDSIPVTGYHRQPVPEEYLRLLPKIGLAAPTRSSIQLRLPASVGQETERWLADRGLAGNTLLGIVPGGGASWGENARFKQWAPERFAETADRLAVSYRLKPLLFGDDSERVLLQSVARTMRSDPILVSPAPTLPLLAGLLRRCRLVLGNDRGPMHLASAVGSRTLSICGPVDASVYGPYPQPEQASLHRVAALGLACRPCYRGFRFPPCPWDSACLKLLSIDQVTQTARELLNAD